MRFFIGLLLLTIACIALQLELLVIMLVLLAVLYLATRRTSHYWAHAVTATRRCNRTIAEVGDVAQVDVALSHTSNLPIVWLLIEDLIPPDSFGKPHSPLVIDGDRVRVLKLVPGQGHTWSYKIHCRRRGYFQIGPLVLETGDMFGLERTFRVLAEPNYLMVLPQVVPLEAYDIASRRPLGEIVLSHRLFEDPTRIRGVREYQPGDAQNQIHWHATARTGKLHSKIYEPSCLAGATLLIDFHESAYGAADEPVRSELAITAAASIANTLYEAGEQIGLLSNGRDAVDRIRTEGWQGDSRTREASRRQTMMQATSDRLRPVTVATSKSPDRMINMLHALARLEKTSGLSFVELLASYAYTLPRDATVIAIIGRVSMELAVALGNLRHLGFAITAVINCYDIEHYARASGLLLNEGIQTRHLREEASIPSICARQVVMA
ncbi:MAG TPA: DUF58 domain-containing protein [Pirellulaceae bacterium]|nr:DUF58 domain-containing protein [Pirellulaceae bacterium]